MMMELVGWRIFLEKKFYACLTKKNVRYIKQVKAMRS